MATYHAYGGFRLTRKTFTICKTTIAKYLGWELGSTAQLLTFFAGLSGECSRVLDPRLNAGLSAKSTKEREGFAIGPRIILPEIPTERCVRIKTYPGREGWSARKQKVFLPFGVRWLA